VAGVATVDACKASCLENRQCDGVLFQKASGKCFRKARLQPRRCEHDVKFTLYVLHDPSRPPSPPLPPSSFLTSAKCSAMMRDPNHKFYKLWANGGIGNIRRRGQQACWDVPWTDNWFDFVAEGPNCGQPWDWTGPNMPSAPTVFGFSETMASYCNEKSGGYNGGDPGNACRRAGINILRINGWNMCRNTEWMMCVAQKKVGSVRGEIVFSLAPGSLDIDVFNANPNGYQENDIYYLEACVLNEMCSNGEEIFAAGVGDTFVCDYDRARWNAAAAALMSQ